MKRLFFIILCYQIGLLLVLHNFDWRVLFIAVAAGTSFIAIATEINYQQGIIFVVVVAVTLMSYSNYMDNLKYIKALDGHMIHIEGQIEKYNANDESGILKINSINGEGVRNCRIIVEKIEGSVDFGGPWVLKINGLVTLRINSCRENPNVMSYNTYLNSVGVLGKAKVLKGVDRDTSYRIDPSRLYSIRNLRIRLFQEIRDGINQLFSSEYNLYSGMILGSKRDIDKGLYERFSLLGVSHILTVSGLHFGVLYIVILKVCSLFKLTSPLC